METAYHLVADPAVSNFNTTHNQQLTGFQTAAQIATDANTLAVNNAIVSATNLINSTAVPAQAAEDLLYSGFESTVASIEAGFQAAKLSAENAIDLAVTAANGIYDLTMTAAKSIYDAAVAGADSAFVSAVASADSAFQTATGPAISAYDASGSADWANYENAIGTGPGGLETTFNSDVASAASTRDGIVSPYPALTFDLSSILMDPDLGDDLSTAAYDLESDIDTINDDFETDADSLVNDFFNNLNAPGGAIYNYNYQITTAENDYEDRLDTAGDNFDSQVETARQTYDNQLNGPSGLVAAFQSSMQSSLDTYNGLAQTAQQNYDSTMTGAQSLHDSTVSAIRDALSAWDESNPYRSAVLARNSAFDAEIDGYLATFQSDVDLARQAREGSNSGAESAFLAALQGPYTAFQGSHTTATTNFNSAQQTAMDDYQDAESDYMNSVMTAMMNGDPMPSPDPLNTAIKQFFVDVAAANTTYTTAVGSAVMSFLSVAFAQQGIRDGQYITNGKTETLANVNDGASVLQLAVTGQSSYFNDVATQVAAYQIAAQAQHNAALSAILAADLALHLTESSVGQLKGQAEASAQETYEKDFESAFYSLRIGAAGLGQTLKNAIATAGEGYQNDVATATAQLVADENTAKGTLYSALIPGLVGLFTSYANLVEARVQSITEKVEDWVNKVSLMARNEFVAENGSSADAVTVGNAWQGFMDDVAGKWKTFTDNSAAAWTSFVTTDSGKWGTMLSTVLGAQSTWMSSVVGAYVTQTSTKSAAGTALIAADAAAGVVWTTSVAGAEKLAYQGLATDAKNANNSYFTALKSYLDSTIQNANSYFLSGLPFLTTATAQISAAGQIAATQIIGAGTSALGILIPARQLRDTTITNAEASMLQGLIPLATSIATPAAQLEVDRAILSDTESQDTLENTPAGNFAGMTPTTGGGAMQAMMLMAILGGGPPVGGTDYQGRFLDTIADPELRELLKKVTSGENSPWQIHHPYQQNEAVQNFLRRMKGQNFDVHDPARTVAVPGNVHSRITAEQSKFWADQWNAIPEASKRKALNLRPDQTIPRGTIANIIAATADREALLAKMEDMIKAQEKYFSPFWLGKGATVADLNKLAAKLGINVGNAKLADVVAKITSKSAVEKFREIYQPRMNQIWEAIKGNPGVINKLKDNANFAGKMAMFAMFTNMVVTDLTLAGDPNAPLWQQAYQDFQIAVDNHESRGWSKPNELENAKASLMAALNGFRSGGDVLGIMRYILEVELENEIQNLR